MLCREGIRQQFPALHAIPHVFEQLPQRLVALALDEQIERRQNRQPSLYQGQELLVENQERALPELIALSRKTPESEQAARFYPVHEVALLRETVPYLRLGVAVLHLLPQMALLVRDFDHEFCHGR